MKYHPKKNKSTKYNSRPTAATPAVNVLSIRISQHSDGIQRYWIGPYQISAQVYNAIVLQSTCR